MTIEQAAANGSPPHSHVDRLERLIHQHLWGVTALTEWAHGESPHIEFVDLSAASPSWALEQIPAGGVASLAVINPSPVTVFLGWPGFRAAGGMGLPVPPSSYLIVPVETNYADIAASAASIAADTEITVIVFEYRTRQRLSAGTLGTSGGGGGVLAVTSESPGSVTVGVASSLILPANIARKGIQAVNSSANTISIGLGHAAVAGNDIVLEASGGAWDGTISGKLWLGALYAIASGAGSNLALAEV